MGDSDATPEAGPTATRDRRAGTAPGSLPFTLACALPAPLIAATVIAATSPPTTVSTVLVLGAGAASAATVHLLAATPMRADVHRIRTERDGARLELDELRQDRDIRIRLERALGGTDNEPDALRVGLRAVAETVPDAEISLLLSLPDEPRIGWQVALQSGELGDAEPIPGAPRCSALVEGATVIADASSLDPCAHLDHGRGGVSTTCVPLRSDARSIGSVCLTTAPGEPLDARVLERVEWIVQLTARRAADHHTSEPGLVGRPEPLTGLPGSSSLRPHLRNLVRNLSPFCLAMVEIDGHDLLPTDALSDAALVTVAGVLCDTLRPGDLICRLDGPTFAAVLAQCSADQAVAAMERVRENLALQLTEASVFDSVESDLGFPDQNGGAPSPDGHAHLAITCSAGVVESSQATSLDDIVGLATAACTDARAAGGNRVAVARHTAGQP